MKLSAMKTLPVHHHTILFVYVSSFSSKEAQPVRHIQSMHDEYGQVKKRNVFGGLERAELNHPSYRVRSLQKNEYFQNFSAILNQFMNFSCIS